MNELTIYLERLSALHRSQLRLAASGAGIQVVHIEILQYLQLCNLYSNTAQALTEYLGQTKGSISQSLKLLEKMALIERRSCASDKRVTRIYVTAQGNQKMRDIAPQLLPPLTGNNEEVELLRNLLRRWQHHNNRSGFGQCHGCRYHQPVDDSHFRCGLTQAILSLDESDKICREYSD